MSENKITYGNKETFKEVTLVHGIDGVENVLCKSFGADGYPTLMIMYVRIDKHLENAEKVVLEFFNNEKILETVKLINFTSEAEGTLFEINKNIDFVRNMNISVRFKNNFSESIELTVLTAKYHPEHINDLVEPLAKKVSYFLAMQG